MILALDSTETKVRLLEVLNALSIVLPLYDPDAKAMFNGLFGRDISDQIPMLFAEIGTLAIKSDPKTTDTFIEYFSQLVDYMGNRRNDLPLPIDADQNYFIGARLGAEKRVIRIINGTKSK